MLKTVANIERKSSLKKLFLVNSFRRFIFVIFVEWMKEHFIFLNR